MSNSTYWMHFYQHNSSGQPQNTPSFNGSVSESVTAAASVVTDTEAAQSNSSRTYSNSNMNGGGRASRPLKKRPRASRRTPIVLLNTDTSNFRAMVQQFTGGPSFPSRTAYSNGINSGFGVGTQQSRNPSTAMAPSGFQMQYFQRQQLQYPSQQHHIFTSLNNNIQGGDAACLLKFRPNTEVEASGGFVNNGGSAHVPPSDGSGDRGGFHQ